MNSTLRWKGWWSSKKVYHYIGSMNSTLTWKGWWSSKKVCHYIGRYIFITAGED
jgi:hypothetical protein